MKYKHRLEKLAIRQKAWDSLKSNDNMQLLDQGLKRNKV